MADQHSRSPEVSNPEKKNPQTSQIQPGSDESEKKDASIPESSDEVGKLKERIIALQNRSKLSFKKVVACGSVSGFGDYSPMEPRQPIPKLILYCEPANVSTLQSGDRYVIDCTVDVLVTDSTGRILLGKEGLVRIHRMARSPIIDLHFHVGMTTKSLLGRTIQIKTVPHEKVKNQSCSSIHTITLPGGGMKNSQDKI